MKQLNEIVQTKVNDFNPDANVPLSDDQFDILAESVTEIELQELIELDRLIDDSVRTLNEIKDLRLVP